VRIGQYMMYPGICLTLVGYAGTGTALWIAVPVGILVVTFAILWQGVVSELDVDNVTMIRLVRWMGMIGCILYALRAATASLVYALLVPAPVCLMLYRTRAAARIRIPHSLTACDLVAVHFTAIQACGAVISFLHVSGVTNQLPSWFTHPVFAGYENSALAQHVFWIAIMHSIASTLGVWYAWATRRANDRQQKQRAMWVVVKLSMFAKGLASGWWGIVASKAHFFQYQCTGTFDVNCGGNSHCVVRTPSMSVLLGASQIIPLVFFALFGSTLRSSAKSHFYKGRRLEDGACLAEIIQQKSPHVGDRHDWHDNCTKTWHEGKVVSVDQHAGGITVNIDLTNSIEPATPGVPRSQSLKLQARQVDGSRSPSPEIPVVKAAVSRSIKLEQRPAGRRAKRRASAVLKTSSAAELHTMGLEELRGISGDKITLELLSSSVGSAETQAMAVSCKPGEIDFFLSHSWHDDPAAKLRALQKVIAAFKRKNNGEAPLFWLDKCCVDQKRISQSLRVLPIFLASCKRMLVVAGPTYVQRLWCIWELNMILMGAAGGKPALDVIGIGGIDVDGSDGTAELYSNLKAFSLRDARCYDPNESRRLHAAIEAAPGGTQAFESAIRGLAGKYGLEASPGNLDRLRLSVPARLHSPNSPSSRARRLHNAARSANDAAWGGDSARSAPSSPRTTARIKEAGARVILQAMPVRKGQSSPFRVAPALSATSPELRAPADRVAPTLSATLPELRAQRRRRLSSRSTSDLNINPVTEI
jgi:hypothetical protein